MPSPYLRREEKKSSTEPRTVGVVVVTPEGKRFFFPGGTPQDGMIWASMVLSSSTLDDPLTSIQFGYVNRGAWVCEQEVKVPERMGA